jgi:hypothetical protein
MEEGIEGWSVICTRRMIPSHREITQAESELAERAENFGCSVDEWGFLAD